MLTISKPLSAGQAQTYHQQEFTAKEQNYWSQRGVIAGEWQGRLAGQFGLAGTVSAEIIPGRQFHWQVDKPERFIHRNLSPNARVTRVGPGFLEPRMVSVFVG